MITTVKQINTLLPHIATLLCVCVNAQHLKILDLYPLSKF